MTLQTNENVAPYFNDYDQTQQYYRVGFKPGVSVQARELNYLQSMLQNQIEQFGTNILATGTIVSGCNFTFLDSYPYVKIQDVQVDGSAVVPNTYYGFFALGQTSGVKALVIDSQDGFEATDPNLKTIYLKYLNGGFSKTANAFSAGEVLLITDANNSLYNVNIVGSGVNFSNNDFVVTAPQIAVNVTSGTFTNGVYLVDPNSTANIQIVKIDTTTLAGNGQVLLTLAPRTVDLANAYANSSNWTFSNGISIRDVNSTMAGTIMNTYGQGAQGIVTTDGSGRVIQITLTSHGNNYLFVPYVTLRSVNNTTGYTSLSLTGQNYFAKPKVATTINAIGNGYAFGVSNGYIFQKGFFLEVADQHIIVSKYNQSPNNIGVAFTTIESTVTSDIDPSLLDNALGSNNYTAPGADRIKLIPTLTLVNVADSNSASLTLPLVEWSEGQPFLQQQTTVYNVIEQKMAQRTYDEAGNFVLSRFNLNTRAPLNQNADSNVFSIIMSPGTAYIAGERVSTLRNYSIDVTRGLDSTVTNNYLLSLNYGNYIRVNQVAGLFQYSTGDTVTFYDKAVGYLSNSTLISGEVISAPAANVIGTSSIRSMILESGTPATNTAIYRLYLFNTQIANGKNFSTAKSVFYNGSFKGIADIIQEQVSSQNSSARAVIHSPNTSCLVFSTGSATIKNSNNVTYTYRTIDQTTVVGNNGILTKTLSSNTNDFFPFAVGNLATLDLQSLYVVPLSNDITSFAAIPGTISVNTTSANIIGTATSFAANLVAGDWIYLNSNSSGGQVLAQVSSVVNSTLAILTANGPFVNATAVAYRTFPKLLPVPFGLRSGLSANVDGTQEILTLNFGFSVNATSGITTAVGVNVNRIGATPVNKSAVRQNYVKINLANNAAGVTGPWCLGVSDVFRLTGVFVGSNSSVDATGNNQISEFTADINHTPDYIGLAFLTLNANSRLQLANTNWLLARFDYFTNSGTGFYNPVSYISSNTSTQLVVDDTAFNSVGASIYTWEIPEFYDNQGNWYDLLNSFDFRPIANNTVTPGLLTSAAPVNPSSTLSFGNTSSTANDKRFPLPGSTLVTTLEQYAGRIDSLFMNKDSKIIVTKGPANINPAKRKPTADKNDMIRIADFYISDYPTLSNNISYNDKLIIDTHTSSVSRTFADRLNYRTVNLIQNTKTPKGYTMQDIKSIDDRVSALEYYTSLNAIESDLTNRIVPSGIDPTLNRFKYGFYVDNFSNTMNSDIYNPEYAATVDNKRAYPKRITWNVGGPPANTITPPCAQTEFICQNVCTGSIDLDCVIDPEVIIFKIEPFCKGDALLCSEWGGRWFDFFWEAAEIGVNPCRFYFHSEFGEWMRYHIYRTGNDGVEVLVATSETAEIITDVDDWDNYFIEHVEIPQWCPFTGRSRNIFVNTTSTLLNFSGNFTYHYGDGRILFTHDCSLGTKYRVRCFLGENTRDFRATIRIPVYTGKATCPPPCLPPPGPCPIPSPCNFQGCVKIFQQMVYIGGSAYVGYNGQLPSAGVVSFGDIISGAFYGVNEQLALNYLWRFYCGSAYLSTTLVNPPCPVSFGCFHCPDSDDPSVWINTDCSAIPYIDLFDVEAINPFQGCYDPLCPITCNQMDYVQLVGKIFFIQVTGLAPNCLHDVYCDDIHVGQHECGKDGRIWMRLKYIPGYYYIPKKIVFKFGLTSIVLCDLESSCYIMPPGEVILGPNWSFYSPTLLTPLPSPFQ